MTSTPRAVVLVCAGEAEKDLKSKPLIGSCLESPLTKNGDHQASVVATRIARHYPRAHLFSAPERRAEQTAQRIWNALSAQHRTTDPVCVLTQLAAFHFGWHDSKPDGREFRDDLNKLTDQGWKYRPENAPEDLGSFAARLDRTLSGLAMNAAGVPGVPNKPRTGPIVVVADRFTVAVMVAFAQDFRHADAVRTLKPPPGSVSEFHRYEMRWSVECVGDTCHLRDAETRQTDLNFDDAPAPPPSRASGAQPKPSAMPRGGLRQTRPSNDGPLTQRSPVTSGRAKPGGT